MHRIVLTLLLMVTIFTLAACGGEDESLTPFTDGLTLDRNYDGLSYFKDGIGIVELASCEDGDTTEFIVEGEQIRLRYLAIDTPEASHYYEPWGYQASQHTCDILKNAEVIVLEANTEGNLRDTFGRYLGFVWADGRNLNLELVELGLAASEGAFGTQYGPVFFDADIKAREAELKMFGETDPLFDYSDTVHDLTIETLHTNYDSFLFSNVTVEGVITSKLGNHFFIEDAGYGVFVYAGHVETPHLEIGMRVELSGFQLINDLSRFGGVHLTNYPRYESSDQRNNSSVTIIDTFETTPESVTLSQLSDRYTGRYINLDDLTITAVESSYSNTIYIDVEDASGSTFTILQHRFLYTEQRIDIETISVGDVINFTGPLMATEEGNMLLIVSPESITHVNVD